MPKKYHGEEERPPRKRGKLEALLKKDPEPIGEIRKVRGKPEPMKPEDIKEFWKQREDRKKQTFKYRPMA